MTSNISAFEYKLLKVDVKNFSSFPLLVPDKRKRHFDGLAAECVSFQLVGFGRSSCGASQI